MVKGLDARSWTKAGAAMLIRVRELELQKLEFDENYQPGAIDFGRDFRQIGPLHSKGRAELIVEHRGHHQDVEDIRLVGNVGAHLEFSCARCLDPVVHDVDKSFDRSTARWAWTSGPMRSRLPRQRPKSAIIRARACCGKMPCVSKCCGRRQFVPYAGKI